MSRFYYSIKRKVSRIRCLLGRHDFKMGVADRQGRPFACLWCRTAAPRQNSNEVITELTVKNQLDAQLIQQAQRRVRNLFGGKS